VERLAHVVEVDIDVDLGIVRPGVAGARERLEGQGEIRVRLAVDLLEERVRVVPLDLAARPAARGRQREQRTLAGRRGRRQPGGSGTRPCQQEKAKDGGEQEQQTSS